MGVPVALSQVGQIPFPPYDLVIVSNMIRSYQYGGQLKSKQSNVYFHCKAACVRAKQPSFSFCSVPWFIRATLTDQHRVVLREMCPVYVV